ncbi:hypothetical protein PENTCL1PPCAC_937 [Pristionchus entomophagus]|uniref:Glycine N-acyltransferase-like protein n=1 Tax=Pristionchus entomophagus TaxID=358040 RepID=A0AAV5S778_9BILA|nr:hypothetical protein PENTCL1PPCAC_937 [Pristionchus entomophagus]
MTRLIDCSSPDLLRELMKNLTEGGKQSHRFENFVMHNVSTWILAGGFPKETMSIYAFPAGKPLYIFMLDQNDLYKPHLFVRTPIEGHNCEILADGLKEIITVALPSIQQHGLLLLDADTVVRATFFKLQETGEIPFKTKYTGEFYAFYMDERQRRILTETENRVPEGFKIDQIDVEKEYSIIHNAWAHAKNVPQEITRIKLANLPSVCIRDSDGNLASWQMSTTFGQLTHLFTFERYRGAGIGYLAKNLLIQTYIKNGLQVYAGVYVGNEKIATGGKKDSLWTLWKPTKNEGDENMLWSMTTFDYTKPKFSARL